MTKCKSTLRKAVKSEISDGYLHLQQLPSESFFPPLKLYTYIKGEKLGKRIKLFNFSAVSHGRGPYQKVCLAV